MSVYALHARCWSAATVNANDGHKAAAIMERWWGWMRRTGRVWLAPLDR